MKPLFGSNPAHVTSNNEHFPLWKKEANEYGSRVFVCLGVNKAGDIQVYPVTDLDIERVPDILREAADLIQGVQKSNLLKL